MDMQVTYQLAGKYRKFDIVVTCPEGHRFVITAADLAEDLQQPRLFDCPDCDFCVATHKNSLKGAEVKFERLAGCSSTFSALICPEQVWFIQGAIAGGYFSQFFRNLEQQR